MKKANIKLYDPNCKPIKTSEEAACWDVRAREIKYKEETNTWIVKLGFSLTPPPGFKLVIVPRSSITNTNLIMQNSPGQGDRDFTGEYQIRFKMLPKGAQVFYYENEDTHKALLIYDRFPYEVGDRVGQMYYSKTEDDIDFNFVEELEDTNRDASGFGSSGQK